MRMVGDRLQGWKRKCEMVDIRGVFWIGRALQYEWGVEVMLRIYLGRVVCANQNKESLVN